MENLSKKTCKFTIKINTKGKKIKVQESKVQESKVQGSKV
jgi:hypothetical protein